MGVFCVNTKSKEFKDTAKRLDIHPDSLEVYVHLYLNSVASTDYIEATDDLPFPSDDEIKEYFYPSNLDNSTQTIDTWVEKYGATDGFVSNSELNEAIRLFGSGNVVTYKNYAGNTVHRVLRPIVNNKKELKELLLKLHIIDNNGDLLGISRDTFYNRMRTLAIPASLYMQFDKELKDQVSLIFKRNPELSNIGTEELYIQYLATLFPNSLDKSIYWHGSNEDFSEGFKSAKRSEGSGALETKSRNDFYLAKQAWSVLLYVNGVNRKSVDKNGFAHWNKLWWEFKEIMSNGRRQNNDWKDIVINEQTVRQAIPNKKGVFNRDKGGENGKWLKERKADYGYENRSDLEFFEEILGVRWGEDTFNTWTLRNAEIFKSLEATEKGIYPAIINTVNPIRETGQNTYYEEQRGLMSKADKEGYDAILGTNTDNEFGSDVAVVLNDNDNVYFLGTLEDKSKFAEFVAKEFPTSINSISNNANYTLETLDIKEKAIADGTFMKAPNGKPTNLNERQWLQVRTKAFKDWFGDWEKVARKNSNTVQPGETIKIGNIDYTITKTEDAAPLYSKNGLLTFRNIPIIYVKESLGYRTGGYIPSIDAIILSETNSDAKTLKHELVHSIEYHINSDTLNPLYEKVKNNISEDSFDSVVSNNFRKNIHEFIADVISSDIFRKALEKEGLLSEVDAAINSLIESNDSSKVVDENGEPLVVYHFTDNEFTSFKDSTRGLHFTSDSKGENIFSPNPNTKKISVPVFLNIKNPAYEWDAKYWLNKGDWDTYHKLRSSAFERGISPSEKKERLQKANSIFSTERTLGNEESGISVLKKTDSTKDGIIRDNDTDYIAFNPNQIKSATDNNGEFAEDNNNIYYQKSILTELSKLRQLNQPLGKAGSQKKMRERLKNANLDPIIVSTIMKAIELDSSLAGLTPLQIFNLITRLQEKGLAQLYNEYLQKSIDKALEEHLLKFLEPFHVTSIEEDLMATHGVTGIYDIINKVIHLAKAEDRNAITVTEEVAHAIVELLGAKKSRKEENKDYTFLYDNIESTDIYKQVYEKYKDTYLKKDRQGNLVKDKDGNPIPDIDKIKKEAIGLALAVAINNKWENEHSESENSFWAKLKEWIEQIFKFFADKDYVNIDTLLNQIATEVIHNSYSRFLKVDNSNYRLLDYGESIANLNKQDGGKALEFMQFFSNEMGNIITGSIAYRKQGPVYRGKLDALHDIDMEVPLSAHGIPLQSTVIQQGVKKALLTPELRNFLLNTDYFKKILAKYPKIKLASAFSDHVGGIVCNAVYSEDESLAERFMNLSGSYASRLDTFTEEERKLIYLFDFFFKASDNIEFIDESSYNLRLKKWPKIFDIKIHEMGRAKDIFDYQMWDVFEEFKAETMSPEEYLMFLKPIQYNPEQLEAIRLVGEYLADENAPEDFFLITGPAGTGKTTIINEIVKNEATRTGRTPSLYVTAVANTAVRTLSGKIDAKHTRRATATALGLQMSRNRDGELEFKFPKKFDPNKIPIADYEIVVIDEASMLNTQSLKAVMQVKQMFPTKKFIMLGDINQLEGIELGDETEIINVFNYKNKREVKLVSRVRQGDTSPILPYSDEFRVDTIDVEHYQKEASTDKKNATPDDTHKKTIITKEGAVIMYKDSSSGVSEKILNSFMPMFEEAQKTKNPNLIKICAIHRMQVRRYNELIYKKLHPEETDPHNPLHKGDLIMFYNQFGKVTDPITKISEPLFFNSDEFSVEEVKKAPYQYTLGITQEELVKLTKDKNIKLPNIYVLDIVIKKDGQLYDITVICPQADNIQALKAYKSYLWQKANTLTDFELRMELIGVINSIEDNIAEINLGYAINVFKAQGSTYDTVVVDAKDIRGLRAEVKKGKNTFVDGFSVTQKLRGMYTAITRASNTTVVLRDRYEEDSTILDIKAINTLINKNKSGEKVSDAEFEKVVKTSEKPALLQPVTPSSTKPSRQTSNAVEEKRDNRTPMEIEDAKWDTIFQQHEDTIEFVEDTHEYYYYPQGKEHPESRVKMDTSVTTITNPVERKYRNPQDGLDWLDTSSNIGSSADKAIRDFFMGIDITARKYPNFTHEQLLLLSKDLKNFKLYLDKQFEGTKYKVVTNPFALVGKITKYNNATQTIGGTLDILIYDENGFYYIYDIKTSRNDLRGKDKLNNYTSQVNMYRELLEAMHPELKGCCGGLGILQLNTFYATPKNLIFQKQVGTVLYTADNNGQLLADGKPIEVHELYIAPHFPEGDVQKAVIDIKGIKPSLYYIDGRNKEVTVTTLDNYKLTSKNSGTESSRTREDNLEKATTLSTGKPATGVLSIEEIQQIVNGDSDTITKKSDIRKEVIDYYKKFKIGDVIEIHDKNKTLSILVRVTKPFRKVDSSYQMGVQYVDNSHAGQSIQDTTPLTVSRTTSDNKEEATTNKKTNKPFSANMWEEYGDDKRDDVTSTTTLDAIIKGERTATTRWKHIEGFYDQMKKGDVVEFHDNNGRSILVRITKAPHKLSPDLDVEEWSKKEGWSEEYFEDNIREHVENGEAYQLEYEYIEGSYVNPESPARSRISNITISYKKNKDNYVKGNPLKHKDTAFIFTENALAHNKLEGKKPIGPDVYVITNVNAGAKGKFNQADIRTNSKGEKTENAFGLIVKKYQLKTAKDWVAQEGCFENNDEDFELFKRMNLEMFDTLEKSDYNKMVFPFEVGLGKAALPKKFAEWLKGQLEARYGIVSTIEKNITPGYKGYGLRVKEVIKSKAAPKVNGENISSKGSEFAKQLTNYGNTVSVEFKGRTYRNAEHAYQTWKSGEFDEDAYNSTAAKPKGSKPVNKKVSDSIMTDILTAKLQQHPELVKGITDRGGIEYLNASTHDVIGDLHWETKNGEGDNGFIKALIKAYQNVTSNEVIFDDNGNPITPVQDNPFNISKVEESKRQEFAEALDISIDHIETPTEEDIDRYAFADVTIVTSSGERIAISPTTGVEVNTDGTSRSIRLFIGLNYLLEKHLTDNPSELSKLPSNSAMSEINKDLRGEEYNSKKDSFAADYKSYIQSKLTSNVDFNSHFTVSKGQYGQRTDENAEWSDITLAIAKDFDTPGEKRTKKAAENKYIATNVWVGTSENNQELVPDYSPLNALIKKAKALGRPIKLNIAGNGIYTFLGFNPTDLKHIDDGVEHIIKYLLDNGVIIEEIRSGGQTGIDEAGIIAAQRLGIKWSVNAPSNWAFRVTEDTFNKEYKDRVSEGEFKLNRDRTVDIMNEKLFKERFVSKSVSKAEETKGTDSGDIEATISSLPEITTVSLPAPKEPLYTPYELLLIKEREALNALKDDKDSLFKPSELSDLAKACMFLVSDFITLINSSRDHNEEWFGVLDDNNPRKQELLDTDFSQMERIEVCHKLGFIMYEVIRNKYFNEKNNPNRDKMKRSTSKKLTFINKNFNAFLEMGLSTIAKLEEIQFDSATVLLVKDSEEVFNGLNIEEITEIAGSAVEHWQVSFRQVSAHASLSLLIKRTLGTLFKLDENGEKVINAFGIPERVNESLAINLILMWTLGSETLELMVDKLKEHQDKNPWLQLIISKLEDTSEDETFKSLFWSNFKKYFQPYIIQYLKVLYNAAGEEIGSQLTNKVINQRSLEKQMLDDYTALQQSRVSEGTPMLLYNADGTLNETVVKLYGEDLKALETYLKAYEENPEEAVAGAQTKAAISRIYLCLELNLDEDTIEALTDDYNIIKNIYSRAKYIKTSKGLDLAIKNKTKDLDLVDTHRKDLESLFSYIVDNSATTLESVSYEDGKLHYSYVTPSYLSNLMDKLKGNTEDYDAFLEYNYGKYEWFKLGDYWRNEWLRLLDENESYRKELQHAVVLTTKPIGSSSSIGYRDKSPMLYEKSMLQNYFYGGNKSNWAFYRIPIMSNKPSEEYIRFWRYIQDSYKDDIAELLVNVALLEIDRIATVRARKADLDTTQIKSFDKNGSKFLFLDYLLPILENYLKWKEAHKQLVIYYREDEDGDIVGVVNDKVVSKELLLGLMLEQLIQGEEAPNAEDRPNSDNISYFDTLLTQVIKEQMDAKFQEYLEDMRKEGLLEYDDKKKLYVHLKDLQMLDGLSVIENLENFFWNDTFAAINILQLTITDIAYYKNAEDLLKRLALIHAPGLRGNKDARWKVNGEMQTITDGKTRTIYISDFDGVVSDAIENIKQAFETLAQKLEKVNPKEAKQYRELAKHIIEAFEDINVTDAQGYNSPTSYRKKAIAFGKWSDDLEEVYLKIRTGEYSTRDLEVMMQPLKPFVYSNTEKQSVGRLSTLKVGMQNKNSEYLLLMMDAILLGEANKGNPTLSKLAAIYQVMEESHYDSEGNYKTDGIDTVQFNSTVKAGEMGVIDINSATTTLLAKKIIEDHIYIDREDKSLGYNLDRVHVLEFEDYCIQNEVPAHLEGESIFGSQMRILSIADMPEMVSGVELFINFRGKPGSPNMVPLKKVKEDYMKAIATNIEESMQELMEKFNIRGTRAERNVALSKLLLEQIKGDSRFGYDLLYSICTDEKGNFNLPLSDPVNAGRVLQLLHSIIKTRINKQMIEGGPVVQVTNFGTSKELDIVFKDANGNRLPTLREWFAKQDFSDYGPITYEQFAVMHRYKGAKEGTTEYRLYHETYLPLREIVSRRFKEEVANKQSGIMYIECYAPATVFKQFADEDGVIDLNKIPEEMKELIGFRIPTEFKYSMAPLKIVGLLPIEAGEGIMLPKDITTLSGSDFDVDKLYIIRPVVKFNNAKFKEEFERDAQMHYDSKGIWDYIYEHYPEVNDEIKREQELYYLELKALYNFLGTKKEAIEKADKKAKKDWLEFPEIYFDRAIMDLQMEDQLEKYQRGRRVTINDLRLSYRELKELRKKDANYYVKIADLNTRDGRNNLIFDTIYAILTSELAMDLIFTPGNFDEPKKYGYMAEAFRLHPEMTYELIQDKYEKEGVDGLKDLIAKSKNLVYNNMHLAFHKLNMVAGKLIGIFALNNVSHSIVSLIDLSVKTDSLGNIMYDGTGRPKLWKPTIMLEEPMLEIEGDVIGGGEVSFDALEDKKGKRISNTLAAFLAASVDAVKDPVLNFMNINETTAGILTTLVRMGYDTELAMLFLTLPIIKEVITKYAIANEEGYESLDSIIELTIEEINVDSLDTLNFKLPVLSKKDLITTLRKASPVENINLLRALAALNTISRTTSAIVSITKFNSVTSAAGPMLSSTMLMRLRVYNNIQMNTLQTESMMHALSNPIISTFRETEFSAVDALFDGTMLLANELFDRIVTRLLEVMNGKLDDATINKLCDFYIAFLLASTDSPIFKTADNKDPISAARRAYIYKALPWEIKKLLKKSDNKFLKMVKVMPADDAHEYYWLKINTRGMSGSVHDDVGMYWQELYLENPDIAMALIEYNFVTSGLGFTPNSFANLIPIALKKTIPNYILLLNPDRVLNTEEEDRLIDLFIRNNHSNSKLIKKVFKIKKENITFGRGYILLSNRLSAIMKEDSFYDYISYAGRLFKKDSVKADKVKYVEISKLGGKYGEILEINPSGDVEPIDLKPKKKTKETKSATKKEQYSEDEVFDDMLNDSSSKKGKYHVFDSMVALVQDFILNVVPESEQEERIAKLRGAMYAELKQHKKGIVDRALKSLFNTYRDNGFNEKAYSQMTNVRNVVFNAIQGLSEVLEDKLNLHKKVEDIMDVYKLFC